MQNKVKKKQQVTAAVLQQFDLTVWVVEHAEGISVMMAKELSEYDGMMFLN